MTFSSNFGNPWAEVERPKTALARSEEERKRLREVLERIAHYSPPANWEPHLKMAIETKRIARAALNASSEGRGVDDRDSPLS